MNFIESEILEEDFKDKGKILGAVITLRIRRTLIFLVFRFPIYFINSLLCLFLTFGPFFYYTDNTQHKQNTPHSIQLHTVPTHETKDLKENTEIFKLTKKEDISSDISEITDSSLIKKVGEKKLSSENVAKISENVALEKTAAKTIIKRTIRKRVGEKQEVTEIVTVHEENKEPETTVTVVESEVPQEEIDELISEKSIKQTKPTIDEILSDVKITEVVTEDKTPEKTIKKRTIKKKVGQTQEITEIITIHEENKEPETTVIVSESIIDTQNTIQIHDTDNHFPYEGKFFCILII